MNELKIVKYGIKKMLRLSRQLMLENEYLQFLNLGPMQKNLAPYLHHKHMERDFLIFKEASFSIRGYHQTDQNEEEEQDPQGNKIVINKEAEKSEKEVQSKI